MTQAPPSSPPCPRCESPFETGDLVCAVCGAAAPAEAGLGAPPQALSTEVLRCDGCDAAVRYDPLVRALRCVFCDAVMHREQVEDPLEQVRSYLPFTVDAAEAHTALRSWMSGLGWFRPGDLTSDARVETLRPLWWVGWIFDAEARVSWTADSNADTGRASWAPHAGQSTVRFDDIFVSASRGLTGAETSTLCASYDLGSARPEPEGVAMEQATIEEFDVPRSRARARVNATIRASAAREVTTRLCPGSTHRNVHVEPRLSGLDTRRRAFPAWVLAYRYRGVLYRVVLSGQDASSLCGAAPYSVARILLVVFAGLALLLTAVLALALR